MPEQLTNIESKLAQLEAKLDATYAAAEKTRKYIMWTSIVTVAFILLPLLVIPLVLPAFLASFGAGLTGL